MKVARQNASAGCALPGTQCGHPRPFRSTFLNAYPRLARHRAPVIPLLLLACAPPAWASYAQMRLDGIAFTLVVIVLYLWGVLLALALAGGLGRHKAFVAAATVVTLALAALLVGVFGDGRATLRPRPLGGWAVFVVLLMAALPVLLAAPFLQLAGKGQGPASRLAMWLVGAAVTLVPVVPILHVAWQERAGERVMERTRALPAGQLQPNVDTSLRRAAGSWLAPYLWNEEAEAKWIILGLSQPGGIADRPAPLSASDTQAIATLVQASATNSNAIYTGKLEGKLVWDRLMGVAPADRPAIAGALSKQEVRQFNEYVVLPHADWLCTPLADPATERALVRVAAQLREDERPGFVAKISGACGRTLPSR
jgi:hypothetical protein